MTRCIQYTCNATQYIILYTVCNLHNIQLLECIRAPPIPPEFWWSTDILSSSIFLQGVDQKILPCGQGRIDSVKINPSLLMMADCPILAVPKFHRRSCESCPIAI